MRDESAIEAVITIDATGRFLDANAAALTLLGVSLAELRESPADRFAMQPTDGAEQAALRVQWESHGGRPLVGTAGLRGADGSKIRVSYVVETTNSGFRARLHQIEGSPEAPSSVFTVGDVLREWRAAERRLAELIPGTNEWAAVQNEIESLRAQYQEVFSAVERRYSEREGTAGG